MIRILDIAAKDILQLLRDGKTFLFLLAMPVVFTLLFGVAFGGFSEGVEDARLPVGYIDEDGSALGSELKEILTDSSVIRLVEDTGQSVEDLDSRVADEELAGYVVVPENYGQNLESGNPSQVSLVTGASNTAALTVEGEVRAAVNRLVQSARMAMVVGEAATVPFDDALHQVLVQWQQPPIGVETTSSTVIEQDESGPIALTHTSPGMMLQFAIAGLLVAAQIIVDERKSRSLQRLLTTDTSRVQILLGHFLAIFLVILAQFALLIAFGHLILDVGYLRNPTATLLVTLSAAVCIAALGLLIGVAARSDEQAIIFSLIPMFVFAGLGGAWVPLEVTSRSFQAIGHLTPVAWAMDGFKNVAARGLGVQSVLLPSAALLGYGLLFFLLAVWRMNVAEES